MIPAARWGKAPNAAIVFSTAVLEEQRPGQKGNVLRRMHLKYDEPRFSRKRFEKRGSFILAQKEGFEPSHGFTRLLP